MKRRITLEVAAGVIIALGFFWWLYLRPGQGPEILPPDSPLIKKSIEAAGNRVLVIGIDALDWDVALDLVNEGRMPNLARLLDQSAHGMMMSERPLISPALWTTMATGMERDVHGIDNFMAKVPFEYREVEMTSRYRQVPPIWQMASWAGLSVGVVNWYAAKPAEALNRGVFVAQGISPEKVQDDQVWPLDWLERVRDAPLPRFDSYQKEIARVGDQRVQKAYDHDRKIFSVALEVLREQKPDLLMVYFESIDYLSHGFWKYSRPRSLGHSFAVPDRERERYSGVIEMHYEFTDRLIGGLLSEAEGYYVIIVSDHGHGPTYPPYNIFLDLNKLLERLGFLKYEGATCDDIVKGLVAQGEISVPPYESENIFDLCIDLSAETGKWLSRGEAKMPAFAVEAFISFRYKFRKPPSDQALEARMKAMNNIGSALLPDRQRQEMFWPKTSAWNTEDFHKDVRGIYLNLREREPEGSVDRDEYRKVRAGIIKSLKSLRSESGDHLFERVRANPAKEMMPVGEVDPPDILVEVNRGVLVQRLLYRSARDRDPIPLSAVRWSYSDVSGDHRPEGVFLVSGPGAKSFRRTDATLYDLCPTILWMLGLPVGSDMPGRVLRDAFDEGEARREPVYVRTWSEVVTGRVDSAPVELTPENRRRFRDLGYIQ